MKQWSLDARSESRTGSSPLGTGEKVLRERGSFDGRSGTNTGAIPGEKSERAWRDHLDR